MVKNITSSFNLITDELKKVKYEDPKEDGNRQDFIDNTIDSKLNNTNYVSFSRAIASDIDNNIITVIEDSQGNKIPVYRLNSAMFNDAYYIKNYNRIGKGYKYYAPYGIKTIYSNDYNDIL